MNSLMIKYQPLVEETLQARPFISSWSKFCTKLFENNSDSMLSIMHTLAKTIENIENPNYFRIQANDLQSYLKNFKISVDSLMVGGINPNIGFVKDNDGLRLSFTSMEYLIRIHGVRTLKEMFEFLQSVYSKYKSIQTTQISYLNHWTLFERNSKMNHNEKYYIATKGTFSSLTARQSKLCSTIPLFRCVMPDIEEEINSVLDHFRYYVSRDKQYKGGVCVRNNAIIIDFSKTNFTARALLDEVVKVREGLMQGKRFKKPKQVIGLGLDVLKNIEARIAKMSFSSNRVSKPKNCEKVDGWGCIGMENEDEPHESNLYRNDVKKLRGEKVIIGTKKLQNKIR